MDKQTTDKAFSASINGHESFYDSYIKAVNPLCKNPIYQNALFLNYQGNHKEAHGMFILNSEDLPENIREICELQRTDLPLKQAHRWKDDNEYVEKKIKKNS